MSTLTSSLTLSHWFMSPSLLREVGVGSVFTLSVADGENGYLPRDIRACLPEVKLGLVKVDVTPEARALIDGWEDRAGGIVPTLSWIRPDQWGEAILLTAAVAEAIGLDGHALTPAPDEGWSYSPLPWRRRMAGDIAHAKVGLPLFARAAGCLEEFVHDEGLQMHLPHLSDRMWDLVSQHCTETVRESVERHRPIIASGGSVCWA